MLARLRLLARQPVVKAALTSGVVMGAGDVLCQAVVGYRRSTPTRIDFERTARFSVVGLTLHGPLFFHGFRALAALKTLAGQLTLFPAYLSLFFVWTGVLEGKAPAQALQKLRSSFAPVFQAGWVFWPVANMANFLLVPPTGRVLYANCAGLLWNTFLSYSNAAANARQEALPVTA